MYNYFDATQIKPKGWLYNQLKIQANGLSGNLHKMWPDISDSAWIGGEHESWERVPYWLDGFIPLAYLLNDKELIKTATHYMNEIINRMEPDGWICPCKKEQRQEYDIWAAFLIGKVLTVYYDFTHREDVKLCLYKSMKCLYEHLKNGKSTLYQWGLFRWFECLIPLQFLSDNYNEDWISEFAKWLKNKGADYCDYIEEWKRPLSKWTLYTHIVNIGMMLKSEALCHNLLGDEYTGIAEYLWNILDKYNGTAVGTFTGDECLAGRRNNRGTELCAVVEQMYSCQLLYAITGKSIWAERMEKMAFNALPAALSDDMWTHQYDQMVNQIACKTFDCKPFFGTNSPDAHLFGLEPNFGCCTANFNQGWPKLVLNSFLKDKNGLLCPYMLPSELNTEINGIAVKITQDTEYPFRLNGKYVVETAAPVTFSLKIRIPKWAKSVKINGKDIAKKEYIVLRKKWNGKEEITLELSDVPNIKKRPFNMKTVEYGPLVFCLPIKAEYKKLEYEKGGVQRKFPYCDYELLPKEEWRYALSNTAFTVEEQPISKIPFSSKNPAITLKAEMQRINWEYAEDYDSVSAVFPKSRKPIGEIEEKILHPYGCSKLRITEMPVIKKQSPFNEVVRL